MKTIHLDGIPSRSITVTDEGYEQIVSLIMASRCCRRHGCAYSEINPVVGVNVCLGCFVTEHTYLTYVGPVGEPDEEGYPRTNSSMRKCMSFSLQLTGQIVRPGASLRHLPIGGSSLLSITHIFATATIVSGRITGASMASCGVHLSWWLRTATIASTRQPFSSIREAR